MRDQFMKSMVNIQPLTGVVGPVGTVVVVLLGPEGALVGVPGFPSR